jgi:hypothetical protein
VNKKHQFLATLHPNQNFTQSMKRPIEAIFLKDTYFYHDILDFHNDLNGAIKVEELSFSNYKFLQFFFSEDLNSANKFYFKKFKNRDVDFIHWMGDSHFRNFLFPETVIDLHRMLKINSVGYLGDCFMNFEINKFWVPVFNFIRVSDPERLADYKSIREDIYWQKIGVNYDLFKKYKIEKEYDLIFIGRPYGNRIEILEYIAQNIPDIKLALYGSKAWSKSKILSKYYKGYLSNKDFYTEIRKSKISLGLLEGPDGITPHFNAKVFDSAFDDVLVISTYYDVLIKNYKLKEDHDIVFYKDYDDCANKIKYYLMHKIERVSIARNLNNKMKNYDMKGILQTMFYEVERYSKDILTKKDDDVLFIVDKNKKSFSDKNKKFKYVYIKENTIEDKYLRELITFWSKNKMLKDINIADLSIPGLILNYKLPISFRGVFYSRDFFIKNSETLLSNNNLSKYWLFFNNKKNSQLLRIILFRSDKLYLFENLIFKLSNIARVIKGKYFA